MFWATHKSEFLFMYGSVVQQGNSIGPTFSCVSWSSTKKRLDLKKKDYVIVSYSDIGNGYRECIDGVDLIGVLIFLNQVDIQYINWLNS